MTIKESFSERLKRTIYSVTVKYQDFYFCISFKSAEEARKYQAMYPNVTTNLFASYLYEKAEEAIAPQKLSLVNYEV